MGIQIEENRAVVVTLTIDPSTINAQSNAVQSFPLPGLRVGDYIVPTKPSAGGGTSAVSARCSTNDSVDIMFNNPTGSTVNPAAETYSFLVFRPEKIYANSVPAL